MARKKDNSMLLLLGLAGVAWWLVNRSSSPGGTSKQEIPQYDSPDLYDPVYNPMTIASGEQPILTVGPGELEEGEFDGSWRAPDQRGGYLYY